MTFSQHRTEAWKNPIRERLEALATSAAGSPGRRARALVSHSTDCRNRPTDASPVPLRMNPSSSVSHTDTASGNGWVEPVLMPSYRSGGRKNRPDGRYAEGGVHRRAVGMRG